MGRVAAGRVRGVPAKPRLSLGNGITPRPGLSPTSATWFNSRRVSQLQSRLLGRARELRRHPMWGEMVASRAFADFSRGGAGFTRLDPDLGEHTLEILKDYGFDIDRIRRLAEARLIFRG